LKQLLSKLQNELKSDVEPTNTADIKAVKELTEAEVTFDKQKTKVT